MEKIFDYKVVIDDNENGTLFIQRNIDSDFESLCNLGSIHGKSASDINELANYMLAKAGMEVTHELVSVWEDTMKNQKDDLNFVRTEMRKALKKMADPSVSVREKKENLAIYQTMCATAQMIINASKLELAYEAIDTNRKRIK